MTQTFSLDYDTKDGDPMLAIIQCLDKAGVGNLAVPSYTRKMLLSSIEFEYDIEEGKIQEWMDALAKSIEPYAHVRIRRYLQISGKAKPELTNDLMADVKKASDANLININKHIIG